MNTLKKVEYLFLHTEGAPGQAYGTVDSIRRYHVKEKGWQDIGYHYVILKDGTVQTGRSKRYQGAHVAGINSSSIGVAMSGNHDKRPPTAEQYKAAVKLMAKLAKEYNVPWTNVLGHREVNILVQKGIVDKDYKTTKTCPGTYIDMDYFRKDVHAYLKEMK